MSLIRLSDAIDNLRKELKLAQDKSRNQDLQFDVKVIEIELDVVAENEGSGSGKINWWILGGGVEAKFKDSSRHKLKLSLQAIQVGKGRAQGTALRVSQDADRLAE